MPQNQKRIVRSALTSPSRRSPKHRLEKPVSRCPLILSLGAVGACTVVVALAATNAAGLGLAAFGATATMHADAAVPAVPAPVATNVVAGNGVSAGPVTGGTTVTVHGADLARVSTVMFGDTAGTVVAATDGAVTITTPPSPGLEGRTVPVQLFDAAGDPIAAKAPAAKATVAKATVAKDTAAKAPVAPTATESTAAKSAVPITTGAVDPAAATTVTTPEPTASPEPPATPVPAAAAPGRPTARSAKPITLTFTYLPDPRVTTQIDYVLAHWNHYNSDEFGSIPGNDCVNFTSQSLLARGWTMDDGWSFNRETFQSTPAWTSSTALAAYLAAHPERATPLSDDERSKVKVGDVVQFDWDASGDRDHTGIVTRVEKTDAGTVIRFAGHTTDTDYASVDDAIAGGATVSYWSIR